MNEERVQAAKDRIPRKRWTGQGGMKAEMGWRKATRRRQAAQVAVREAEVALRNAQDELAAAEAEVERRADEAEARFSELEH